MPLNGFTEEQKIELSKSLRPDVVKEPPKGKYGQYIEAWHTIAEANRIFGFDGWDRETVEMRLVSERDAEIGYNKEPGFSVSYIAKVRITVRAGGIVIVREGTGGGHGSLKSLGDAHESAAKEAESTAMKRALMQFGNQFGLALYDKEKASVGYDAPAPTPEMSDLSDDLVAINDNDTLTKWMTDNKPKIERLVETERATIKRMCAAKLSQFKKAAG